MTVFFFLSFCYFCDIEVSLNSTMMKADSESKTQTVGEILQIGIWVHNTLAWPLANITLQLYFFQDYQNGVTNNHLESCLSIIGSTEVILPQVCTTISRYTNNHFLKFYHNR